MTSKFRKRLVDGLMQIIPLLLNIKYSFFFGIHTKICFQMSTFFIEYFRMGAKLNNVRPNEERLKILIM